MLFSKFGGKGQPGASTWARPRRNIIGFTVTTAILLSSTAPLAAQTGDPLLDRSIPTGSPLNRGGVEDDRSQPANQASAMAATTGQAATRVEPVLIEQGRASITSAIRQAVQESASAEKKAPAPPGEFEQYVQRALGRKLPRFGANLLIPAARDFQTAPTAPVPASYILGPGDRIFIGLSGSIDGTIDAEIDNEGRIFIPKVGPVRLAGVNYGNLRPVLREALGRQYRDFNISAAITGLRGVHVYVTGYANNPGSFTVSSLSTMVNAVLAAGGPSAGGSFRSIKLFRRGQLISDFDLYDLLLRGDKSHDAVLQNEDVLYINPVGPQVAIAGSVNAEAIYETKPGEPLDRVLAYAGGTTPLADSRRVILHRLSDLDSIGGREVTSAELAQLPSQGGDLVQVLATGTLARSLERQSVVVRIEGEVAHPGNYYVPANTSLDSVLAMAGGLTSKAFVFGTSLERLSVRQQQQRSFDEAISQLELSLAAAPLVNDSSTDAATRATQMAASRTALDRLKATEPDGRIILDLKPDSVSLPGQLVLENSDRIYVPPVPSTVGVFGAVYRPASFLLKDGKRGTVGDYLKMAGGPMRAADRGEVFVVRANGEVISKRSGALGAPVVAGDVIFVPVRTSNNSAWMRVMQISTLVFQLGLAAATVAAVLN